MRARRFFSKCVIPALLAATTSASALAMEFAKPSDAVALREHQMALIANYFGDMGAMVKKKKPYNAAQFRTDAERLAVLASWAGTGFEKASYMTSDSDAKPSIWQNKAHFDKLMSEFATNANHLKVAAASGDLKTSTKAFKTVVSSCESCHKQYKN